MSVSAMGGTSCYVSAKVEDEGSSEFPAGLKVLVVDADMTCLTVLKRMLLECRYDVTTCSQATRALTLLRESKGSFDVVISDVHMPDMDGFRLLELVGLEMDLPVIMMSADTRTNVVMKGIKHGVCNYLIKPVRMEELKNIWQHVVRKKWNDNKELEFSGSLEESDRNKRITDNTDYASSINDGADGSWKSQKNIRDPKEEDDGELNSGDPSSSKKPRVVWSVELHQQFVNAVNQLRIDRSAGSAFNFTAKYLTSCYVSAKVEDEGSSEFPAGLKVLVVDDDMTCLTVLKRMLLECRYDVTTCSQATRALTLLRESKGSFDVVISDVHMPDMDGFRLLELVGLEMDLPVIMMSADTRTNVVMKGIKHGACDYLIKPVRMEELKNIWQHVVRKKWNDNKELEFSGSLEESDRNKRITDNTDYASSINDGADGSWKSQKNIRDPKEEDDGELNSGDPSSSKKPRVVWSVELHQQFVNAVNQLRIDKAVPKRILELMNVPGLTRENVASHLQKFRLYLKRLSRAAQNPSGLSGSLCGLASNAEVGPLGRVDFQALVASGRIPPETLAALQDEILSQPSGSSVMPTMDQLRGTNCVPIEREISFGQPLLKCHTDLYRQIPQSSIAVEEIPTFPTFSHSTVSVTDSTSKLLGLSNCRNDNMAVQVLQQQQSIPWESESLKSSNVKPSCLVDENPMFMNQNPLAVSQGRNLGFVGKGTCIPSLFALDEVESPSKNLSYSNTCIANGGNIVNADIFGFNGQL